MILYTYIFPYTYYSIQEYRMLNLVLPKHLLSWCMSYKETLSLPSLIIQVLFYIKDNNIPLESIQKEREKRTNDRTRTHDGVRKT